MISKSNPIMGASFRAKYSSSSAAIHGSCGRLPLPEIAGGRLSDDVSWE
jgi:hypothetical protein